MHQTPLLQTKLHIPATRSELVSRPRLLGLLNAAVQRKLTLLSAPAGFGKTTLVSEWVNDFRSAKGGLPSSAAEECPTAVRCAWLSLDESDNDPTRFLSYLLAALRSIQPRIGKGLLGAMPSPQPPLAEVSLITLINDIDAVPSRMILVLDDYHLIEAQSIHDALSFLLEHLPPRMHLLLATREDPPLPLARLRARGQSTELRAADLKFTFSEAAEFLNQMMGLDLAAEEVAALERRTEGWIAGLQLAALSMQGCKDTASLIRSFAGSHRFVLDYLVDEVLQQQSGSVQTFLLETAILDRLTGSLCDTVRFGQAKSPSSSEQAAASSDGTAASSARTDVSSQDSAQAILEMLEHANLFIVPLDDERRWYRYHRLFADLLRLRLHQTQPERPPILHRRASKWYEGKGLVDEAIDHALRGRDYERAAHLIEDQFGENYERGDQATLRRWLAELPEELVSFRPELCILQAWNLFTSGQLEAADRSLQVAERMLDATADREEVTPRDRDQLSEPGRRKLAGRVAAIRAFLASYGGDTPATIRYARQALEYLPEQEMPWRSAALITLGDAYASQGQMLAAHEARSDALVIGRASGDTYVLTIVSLRLAEILRQQGKLHQVIDICDRQLKRAVADGIEEAAVVGWLLGIWGEVLAELNDLDGALDRAKKGAKLAAAGGDVLYEVLSILCLVRVLFSRGDVAGAGNIVRSMEEAALEYEMPLWALPQLSAWQVRIWLAQGKLEIASRWARERELRPVKEPAYLYEMEHVALARILIAQGRLDEADRLLQRLLEAARAGGRSSRAIEILVLQALAAQSGGNAEQAMSVLEQALALAEPGDFIRVFADEGPAMARLLYQAATRGLASDYVPRLLAAFPAAEPELAAKPDTRAAASELIEPLSNRELEVLELIAEGLTNAEIAARLYLSLNTVKGHCRSIYGKLAVHSRTQAVARARALGALPTL
jgi:LuxR family maltose regulon positive regulatory protein